MNIFYDNVDANLQNELNARGEAGMQDRTNKSLNFMLGKIANVQCTAYEGSGSASKPIINAEFGILGGATTTTSRYLPSGPDGYLTTRQLERTEINFYKTADEADFKAANPGQLTPQLGEAYTKKLDPYTDSSKRVGPYLTSIDVTIGDHSMGLLNKATISFVVPNPERDLDAIENTWFHPGRFVKLDIVHPESAIINKDDTGRSGLLLETTAPNIEKLRKLYPGIDANKLQAEIRRMNIFTFEGLITSFEFSYTTDASVEATIQLTGTSNVYADISMYLPDSSKKPESETAGKINTDPALGTNNFAPSSSIDATGKTVTTTKIEPEATGSNSFFTSLSQQFDIITKAYETRHSLATKIGEHNILTKFYSPNKPVTEQTDQYILTGRMYDAAPLPPVGPFAPVVGPLEPINTYERYITLGALIQFINDQIVTKYEQNPNDPKPVGIIHTDTQQYSNYYPYLTSCIPHEILFLPKDPATSPGMNWHGNLGYYSKSVTYKTTLETTAETAWPGVTKTLTDTTKVICPSRIFINLNKINQIASLLGQKNLKTFTISAFLSAISNAISYASGGAINLKLVSDKTNLSRLLFADTLFLKSNSLDASEKKIEAYSIPMFANHKHGSVVRDFKFSATLPDSVKNLSYVLNSGDKITNDQIAPYMNFMYNSKNPAAINEAIKLYKLRHQEILTNLTNAKLTNGQLPYSFDTKDTTHVTALYIALSNYIKLPTDSIQKSQQITAPIFPFTAEFTIDGINGLRYGDVLTFEALPTKYRVNTVFSVISITHTVTNAGEWTTAVRCIMRPSIN